ncbi:MAG: BlaI/MecI/CopY family transcriptional regulator [Clostridia bacterium]|nr:BlaI/MecI/CopY family transcriptional regulator [Clostridia bacterium]
MSDYRLAPIEARFAEIIWSKEPLTTAELVKECEKELNWKRTTTYTVLKRLSERGIFENDSGIVRALISKKEFYARQSKEFVEDSFNGSLPAFLAAFSNGRKLTEKEIVEIKKLIDGME